MFIQLTGTSEAKAFRQAVSAASGQKLSACLQCGKCSGGCPVASSVARGPRQMIEMILLGLKQEVLRADLPWYCVGCAICASRCPVQIDFSRVAAVLVEMALAEGYRPADQDIHRWDEVFLASVRHAGRVHEVRAILENNVRAKRPWQDALLGLAMFARGILRPEDVLAGPAPGRAAVARIFENVQRLQAEGKSQDAS